jgi:hypothetical protein
MPKTHTSLSPGEGLMVKRLLSVINWRIYYVPTTFNEGHSLWVLGRNDYLLLRVSTYLNLIILTAPSQA